MDIIVFNNIVSFLDREDTMFFSSVCKNFRKFIHILNPKFEVAKRGDKPYSLIVYTVDFLGRKNGKYLEYSSGNPKEIPELLDLMEHDPELAKQIEENSLFIRNKNILDTRDICRLHSVTYYKNNKKDGIRLVYHLNRRVMKSTEYNLGIKHGLSCIYCDTGQVREYFIYERGIMVEHKKVNGDWYDLNRYSKSEKNGWCEEGWCKDGISVTVKTLTHYKNGSKHGMCYTFRRNVLVNTTRYLRGIAINECTHHRNKRIFVIESKVGDSYKIIFHPNGKVHRYIQRLWTGHYYIKHGLILRYDLSGSLEKKSLYFKGKKILNC